MRKFIESLLDTECTTHIASMLLAITITAVSVLLFIQFDKMNNLQQDAETYKNLFLAENHNQRTIILDLEDLAEEQEILNASLNARIHSNFDYINENYSIILENKVDIDSVSYEGINERLKEIEADIKRLYERGN